MEVPPTRDVEIDEIPEFEVIPVEMRRSGEHADGVGEAIPRRVKLTKEIMERFDFTPQCPGCINMRLNRPHRAHTEQCRERVEEKVREDAALRWRVEAAHARQAAWTERERIRLGMPSAEPAIAEEEMEGRDMEVHTPPMSPGGDDVEIIADIVHIPDNDVPVHAEDDAAIFNHDANDNERTSRKRDRDLDDGLEIEEQMRGEIYVRRDDEAAASSSAVPNWIAASDPYQVPLGSVELIEVLGQFGVDQDRLSERVRELEQVAKEMQIMGVDVAEIFSPPRVVAIASRYGLRPGFSLDLSVNDEDGMPWDFSKKEQRHKAKSMVIEQKPWLLIGSPPCTMFSILQNLNKNRSSGEYEKKYEEAMKHVGFCIELYKLQIAEGRYFLHEHPLTASSWRLPGMISLLSHPEVACVTSDMCQYGMTQKNDRGEHLPVLKPTRWLGNSPHILYKLSRRCKREHQHQVLLGGRAKQAQVYPEELCCSILQGLRRQLTADGVISNRFVGSIAPEEEEFPENGGEWNEFCDEVGNPLESGKVREARLEEIAGLIERGTYVKVPITECYQVTGEAPIKTRFVDINKGDHQHPNYRSRLVATEIKAGNPSLEHFAAMPPLEAKKALFSLAATRNIRSKTGKKFKLGFIDVSKAYLYAPVRRDVYIQLPEEDRDKGYCGKLVYSLYGTRDAAQNWENEYTSCLEGMGFRRGTASPCTFFSEEMEARIVVHGDDFTVLATEETIREIYRRMSERYKLKLRGILGPDSWDDKEITILNRVIRWNDAGIEYEPDPRHAEYIVSALGLHSAKPVTTPGVKLALSNETEEPLDSSMHTQFRALVARANYLAQDRADIQFSVKELARRTATPTSSDWQALKRLGRYLLGVPRVVTYYLYQGKLRDISVAVDSDWAGCMRTRRSTSGGLLRMGKHIVKSWANTQATVALSSGEAEYASAVKGCAQALGFRTLLQDLGVVGLNITCMCDSSAAIGVANRTGVGKIRHLAVHLLWLQEKVRSKEIAIQKVDGVKNPADLLTKHIDQHALLRYMHELGLRAEQGRAAAAPELQ